MSRSHVSLAVFTLLMSASAIATAGDSTWLMCKGTGTHGAGKDAEKVPMLASLLEQRGQVDASRDLSVTLVYGVHVMRGTIVGKNGNDAAVKGSAIKLTSVDGKNPVLVTGTGELAKKMDAFTIAGKIDWSFGEDKPMMQDFNIKLTCEEVKK